MSYPKLRVFADERVPLQVWGRWFPDRASRPMSMIEVIAEGANEAVSRSGCMSYWRIPSRPPLEDRNIPLRKEY